MYRRIRKRWLLVLLLSAGQFLCLVLAVLWFANLTEAWTRTMTRVRVLEASRHFARQTAASIAEWGLQDISRNSPDWDRLQRLVERTQLPNEGFICVIDGSSGAILCHPELTTDPSLSELHLGAVVLHGPEGDHPLLPETHAASAVGGEAMGWTELADGTHLIAVHDLPNLDACVVVQQPQASLDRMIADFIRRVRVLGLIVTAGLTILLTLVTIVIVRRYENRLAHINENLEDIVENRTEALLQSRSAVILGLAKLAESRDDETGQHLERIRRYVRILAEELENTDREIDRQFVDTIVETSALHDIGKVGVPDEVLLKPGPLTGEQRRIIEKHPLIGGDTLLAVKQRWGQDQFLVTACEIAFAHHERYDGKGYPFGLAGEMIPLSARIVALADVYDALTTRRVYKPAVSHDKAAEVIRDGSGTHFDPKVIDAFLAVQDRFRAVHAELEAE